MTQPIPNTGRPDGGYAIKHLAAQYGVDYGDVLLWIEHLRRDRRWVPQPRGRFLLFCEALERIHAALGSERHEQLLDALVALANARWGEPEPVRVG